MLPILGLITGIAGAASAVKGAVICDPSFPECGTNCKCVDEKKRELARIQAEEQAAALAAQQRQTALGGINLEDPKTLMMIGGGLLVLILLLRR